MLSRHFYNRWTTDKEKKKRKRKENEEKRNETVTRIRASLKISETPNSFYDWLNVLIKSDNGQSLFFHIFRKGFLRSRENCPRDQWILFGVIIKA